MKRLGRAGIKSLLIDRVDRLRQSVGIVVGVVDDKGKRIISHGKPRQDTEHMVSGNSVFEIGSVTKVYTAILLADMVERGEVSLDDPISKYLPKAVKTPTRDGREITLFRLCTQTSGLPRMPNNMNPKDRTNPYANYTVERMYAFLSGYTPTRDIGAVYEYSNYGFALLGHILSLRAGADYETMVRTRICTPLKMNDTGISLTSKMQAHLAEGHNRMLWPVRNWDLATFAGAGSLRSTASDVLTFIAANMGLRNSRLLTAMQRTHRSQHNTNIPNCEIGLGWHILRQFQTEIVWHNGGTGGYHSFIGFDKQQRRGVVVLSNSANDIDDIGRHILDTRYPLAKIEPPREHKAIELDPGVFDAYVGEYQVSPGLVVTLSREGNEFFAHAMGQKFQISAETEDDFFCTAVDGQVTVAKDDKGQVTHLLIHYNGVDHTATRIK